MDSRTIEVLDNETLDLLFNYWDMLESSDSIDIDTIKEQERIEKLLLRYSILPREIHISKGIVGHEG